MLAGTRALGGSVDLLDPAGRAHQLAISDQDQAFWRALYNMALATVPNTSSRLQVVAYIALEIGQLMAFVAYIFAAAGLGTMQNETNALILSKEDTDAYVELFKSTGYFIPYPGQPKYQFGLQWWMIHLQLALFFVTAPVTWYPSLIPTFKVMCVAFSAVLLLMGMDAINAMYFLLRSDFAQALFDATALAATNAGFIIFAVSNGLTIIGMGLYDHASVAEPAVEHKQSPRHHATAEVTLPADQEKV